MLVKERSEEHGTCEQDLVSTDDCMQYNAIGEGGARELARVLELNSCITHLNVRVGWWMEGV